MDTRRLKPRLPPTRHAGPVSIGSASLVFMALVLTVQSVLVSFFTHSALPQEDEWASLSVFRSVLTRANVFADVFSQHNEHRIAFPRLILFADYLFFWGEGWFSLVVILVTQGLLSGLFLFLLFRSRPKAKGTVAIGAMVPLLLFSLRQSENFVWGFQVQFVGVFAAAALAIALFCRGLERLRAVGSSGVLMPMAYALVAVATFSMSNGLLSGLVLIILALLDRAPRPHIIGAVMVTAGLTAAFSFGYRLPESGHLSASWLHDPVGVMLFAAAYLGNFLDPDIGSAVFLGLCGLAAMAAIFARFATRRDTDPMRLALLGIALFTAGSAALTALGRAGDGLGSAMASRYATGAACFWSALLICGWSLSGRSRQPVGLRLLLGGACLVLVTAIVQAQSPTVSVLQDQAFQQNLIGDALYQGLIDETALEAMNDNPAEVRDLAPFLRERGISIFASGDARLFGRQLSEAGTVETLACPATFDAAVSTPRLGANGLRVEGTTTMSHLLPQSDRIFLVDSKRLIVGFASTRFGETRWSGYATAPQHAQLEAFARLGSGRLCALGGRLVSSADASTTNRAGP